MVLMMFFPSDIKGPLAILPASYLYDLDWLFLKTTQNILHKYSVVSFACLLMLTYFLQPV